MRALHVAVIAGLAVAAAIGLLVVVTTQEDSSPPPTQGRNLTLNLNENLGIEGNPR